ncbi:MAG: hypothetical protein LPK19_06765, partial [Hymenobacteraceae bacterium]|nr:hypothetical protein [Hymenobacteraceae bacterium]MDX5395906.1 hypothetical protein [Hymenobacteraceae bacterium]MDX5511961.1 hypothetical protein [Hymenobacteraceae bacterium]
MLRKLLLHVLILTTCFNLAGGYAVAASLKAASFSICTGTQIAASHAETSVKKASSDLVIVASAVSKEGEEEQERNYAPDFAFQPTSIPGFLPLLRAGPVAPTAAFSSAPKSTSAPLFVLNCIFRL